MFEGIFITTDSLDLAEAIQSPEVSLQTGMTRLMAYGPTFAELDSRVVSFVHRILNGAKPAVLAIEQPRGGERGEGLSLPLRCGEGWAA